MPLFPKTVRWTSRNLNRAGINRPRVLVVDDYRDGAEAMAIFLSMSGYDTHFVLSGLEVADAITTCPPHIVLLDINMPAMDGFAVARQLRQDSKTRGIVIVAFTAQDELAIRTLGTAAGFDGYCQKGGSPEGLLNLFDEMAKPEKP